MVQTITQHIIQAFGGVENIRMVGHCMNRLRIMVNDESVVDIEKIQLQEHILGYSYQKPQHQILLDKNYVSDIYNDFIKQGIMPSILTVQSLKLSFEKVFGYLSNNIAVVFAPGRVNLIGEHTDYNGGKVFPAALDIGTYLVISPRQDNNIRFYSLNFDLLGVIETTLSDIGNKDEHLGWVSYPLGVLHCLSQKGYDVTHGFDVFVQGTIPHGAGLSSSASLGVSFVKAMDVLFKFNIDPINIALIAQQAEHYAGTMCGIMDQFASSMGKESYGILLDCHTLEYKYAPVDLGKYTLIIMNSNKQRALNESKYNERRKECEKGLKLIQQYINVTSLGELTEDQFNDQIKNIITDSTILKRVKHAIFENSRTEKAYDALQKKDLKLFGKLLNESHYSLRDDYEVSGKELDVLTESARKFDGVLGSRMTGAGFGGCAIAIVPTDKLEEFQSTVAHAYKKETGLTVQFIEAHLKNGAKQLS